MNTNKTFRLVLILLLVIISFQCRNHPKQLSKKTALANGKLTFVELSGTPYGQGFKHGELLSNRIQELIEAIKTDTEDNYKVDADSIIQAFMAYQNFESSIKKFTPNLWDEIRGVADGSNIAFNDIYWLNLYEEYSKYLDNNIIPATDAGQHCTSFGVDKTDANPSMAGQNMDISEYWHPFLTLFKTTDQDRSQLYHISYPGIVGGGPGINKDGISINVNCLDMLKCDSIGLPYACVVRGALQKKTYKEALNFIETIPHATGHNYLLGGKEKVANLECSSSQVKEFRPFNGATFTYNANVPHVNNDFTNRAIDYANRYNVTPDSLRRWLISRKRTPVIKTTFNESTEDFDKERIINLFRYKEEGGSGDICKPNTNVSVLFILSDEPKMLIAPDEPDTEPYIEFGF
ncbi:C45 family peptidase [Gaetbulibacter sp. M240]|uniref:C45 family autoproteolytic acyltransferase/hydolase n=1 Tax=Gaetbulibacter sp. M240 TaxID=3126511 RepID=UPI00374EB900